MHTEFVKRRPVTFVLTTAAALVLGASVALAATDSVSELAARLATLRGEVEDLSTAIEASKTETRGRLRSIGSQRGDLEMQVQKEELRLKQLRQARAQHLEEVRAGASARAQLEPTVLANLDRVRQRIERGLPFKVGERRGELDELERHLREEVIPPEKGAARLWQFVEDELRLTRESGLYRQTLVVEGDEMLVEVARLGMVAMYFRTQDGRVGHVRRGAQGWETVVVSGEPERAQIDALFEAFTRNIRVGYFVLPNGLITAGGAR